MKEHGGGGEEGVSTSVNIRNIHEKILFQVVLNEVLKSCEK